MEWWNKPKYKKPDPFSDRDKHQKFYQTPAWQRLRLHKLANDPLCELCLKNGHSVSGEEIDHVISLTDDYSLRLDYDNLQTLCKPCHSYKTTQEVHERKKREQQKQIDCNMEALNEFD